MNGAMWRVNDCSTHGGVVYYRMSQSGVSVIFVGRVSFFQPRFLTFFVVDFDLSLPMSEKFFWSNDTEGMNRLFDLDRSSNGNFSFYFSF